jgi:V/A-type H+-transporting ATPase subunit C
MAAGCDYAVARVRAMRSRLLGRAGIAALLAERGLAARLELLKRTDYGEALAAHPVPGDPLAEAERGLSARLMHDLEQIDRFLAGERVRALFRAILAFEDGWMLKTILRGVAAGQPPERIVPLLMPTPGLGLAALAELVRQRDVKAVVDMLATWRSPYAPALLDALGATAQRLDLLPLEVVLDRLLFGRAIEAARGDGEDGRMLHAFLEAQIDLVNAATRLKLGDQGGAEEFLIPGGRPGRAARDRAYALLAGVDDPAAADQMLHRTLAGTIRREASRNPLSLAVPLSYVLDRRAEIQRIRLVLRGAEFGLPAADLLELVEA